MFSSVHAKCGIPIELSLRRERELDRKQLTIVHNSICLTKLKRTPKHSSKRTRRFAWESSGYEQ